MYEKEIRVERNRKKANQERENMRVPQCNRVFNHLNFEAAENASKRRKEINSRRGGRPSHSEPDRR